MSFCKVGGGALVVVGGLGILERLYLFSAVLTTPNRVINPSTGREEPVTSDERSRALVAVVLWSVVPIAILWGGLRLYNTK
jgi:hypothetical protein